MAKGAGCATSGTTLRFQTPLACGSEKDLGMDNPTSTKTIGLAVLATFGVLLGGAVWLGYGRDSGAHAQTAAPAPMLDAAMDDAEFGERVRAYLLSNPEVIMEAVAVLEGREQTAQVQADVDLIAAHADAIYNDGYSWVGGNPDGDVTIVEFMDYRCGYCRKAHPEVTELVESDGNIRLIIKEMPVLGEASVLAARFAIATKIVAGDEAYGQIHDAMMTLTGNPSQPIMSRLASTLGLDADAIFAEMDSDEVTKRLQETRTLAQQLQINGTPGFVMAGQMMRGYAPIDVMRGFVEEARAQN